MKNIITLFLVLVFCSFSVSAYCSKSASRGNFLSDVKFEYKFPEGPSSMKNGNDIGALRVLVKKEAGNLYNKLSLGTAIIKDAYYSVAPKRPVSARALLSIIKSTQNNADVKSQLLEAKKLLDDVIEKAPDEYPMAYFARGVAYMLGNKFPEALADYFSAISSNEGNPYAVKGAFVTLSFVWDTLSDEQKAEWGAQIAGKVSENLSISNEKDPNDYLLVSKLYLESQDPEKAAGVLEAGISMYPDDVNLVAQREQFQKNVGDNR